jgi:hypothetical protein
LTHTGNADIYGSLNVGRSERERERERSNSNIRSNLHNFSPNSDHNPNDDDKYHFIGKTNNIEVISLSSLGNIYTKG